MKLSIISDLTTNQNIPILNLIPETRKFGLCSPQAHRLIDDGVHKAMRLQTKNPHSLVAEVRR